MLGELRVLGYATWFHTTELRRNVRNVFVSECNKFETIVFSKVFTLRSLVLVACTNRGISGIHLAARPFRCVSAVLQSVFVRTCLQCTQTHICLSFFFFFTAYRKPRLYKYIQWCVHRELDLSWSNFKVGVFTFPSLYLWDIRFLNLTPSTYSL